MTTTQQFGPGYPTDLDLIFANPDGTPLRPDSISASVFALFKRLKLPKPRGASLRPLPHSHGSHLSASGMELTAVSERLGHSSPFVTATVYSHAIKEGQPVWLGDLPCRRSRDFFGRRTLHAVRWRR